MDKETGIAKKQKKAMNTLVIIFTIVLCSCLMTWIIPAGQFARVKDAMTGRMVVDATTFQFVKSQPVNPILIPMHIAKGAKTAADLLFLLLCSGAAFFVVIKTGAMHSSIGALALKYRNRRSVFVVMLFIAFCFIMITQSVDRFMGFAPVLVMICLALGLDSITAIAIITGGSACGFATGMFNINTTLIAQELAGLPPFSGLWYRAICFVLYMLLTGFLLWRYTVKITKDPTASPMYDLDQAENLGDPEVIQAYGPMTLRKWLVTLSMAATLGVMIWGCIWNKWTYPQISSTFIILAVVSGLCAKMTPSEIAKNFIEGAKSMVMVFFLVAAARAISTILADGKILDTIVYAFSIVLKKVPSVLQAPAMFIVNILVNVVIPSGSGQAAAVMPIMLPLADIIGMTRQTAILAFNFGDGFCNWVIPTGSALMGVLGMAKIPFDRWLRYSWPVFRWWVALGCVLVAIAHAINLA
ncbi:MAG: Na+/H+ antiporter NhaC family protein [Pyramidobacter sp.]|uniref:YfcC family protein n=1 Tax=Pyramidobacter sp. TaxID=1943581 RepID=UPI002A7FFB10|nr:Na+/H+ antiporter NhaC family protein [Pyramidobacter sp.]MDY4032976.1 Na+/H+ antiporter NhaC family protein [Pyramidobacter sp.]